MKVWLLLALGGCTGDSVVLADLPAEWTQEGARCSSADDCTPDRFCETVSCRDLAGSCRSYPEHCDAPLAPVCGCDGVTYESACARRAAGVAADVPGACPPKK